MCVEGEREGHAGGNPCQLESMYISPANCCDVPLKLRSNQTLLLPSAPAILYGGMIFFAK